ncbi:DUF3035 domain-containing protein [Acidimangrovimonas pyrenivorans]|uniref:DUF3035 domain-containing protein n=1 Tax=Acidimangrovimonas pyrenivorans TaxID=2030798 RepID=A0ABV7ABZ7_9RHOB
MQAGRSAFGIAAIAMLALAGCSGGKDPHLMNFRSNNRGPDEFAVLPSKPLQMPKNFSQLPPPTPGGTNLTDPTPKADAVAALGGRARSGDKVPAGDSTLVTQAARYGIVPDIRAQLAAADLQYRRKHRPKPLEKVFGVTTYFRAYRPMALDQYAELERWRAAGVRTESAPPDPAKQQK